MADDVLRIERRERIGPVAVARLNPGKLQQRFHRLEPIGRRAQQTRRFVTPTRIERVSR